MNAVLGPLTIVAYATPGGQPVAVILHAIKTVGGLTKDVIDMVIPTDLERVDITIQSSSINLSGTSKVTFLGEFHTQDNIVIGTVRTFVNTAMAVLPGLSAVPGAKEAVTGVTEAVLDIFLEAGINASDAVSAQTLSGLKKRETGVPLDMSLYRLDVISLLKLVLPTMPTYKISNFLERVGVDLSPVTVFTPVEVSNSDVATYNIADAQLTGVRGGTTLLTAKAYKFDSWESALNVLGIQVPIAVGPFTSQNFVVRTAPVPSVLRPDLLVDRITFNPSDLKSSTPLKISVRAANTGNNLAPQTWVVLRIDGKGIDSIAVDIGSNQEAIIEFDSVVLTAGSHSIEVVADPNRLLSSETNRENNRVVQTVSVASATPVASSLVFILDLSGSMNDGVTGGTGTRLQAAKDALSQVLQTASSDGSQEYALVTFGGNACEASIPVPFTTNPQRVIAHVENLSASGSTPLAAGLRDAQHLALDFASSDHVQVVPFANRGRVGICVSCGDNRAMVVWG